jgi:hypothetical protein
MLDWMGKTSSSRCFRNGLCKCNEDGTYKSSVDKFYDQVTYPGQRQLEQKRRYDFVLSGPADKN